MYSISLPCIPAPPTQTNTHTHSKLSNTTRQTTNRRLTLSSSNKNKIQPICTSPICRLHLRKRISRICCANMAKWFPLEFCVISRVNQKVFACGWWLRKGVSLLNTLIRRCRFCTHGNAWKMSTHYRHVQWDTVERWQGSVASKIRRRRFKEEEFIQKPRSKCSNMAWCDRGKWVCEGCRIFFIYIWKTNEKKKRQTNKHVTMLCSTFCRAFRWHTIRPFHRTVSAWMWAHHWVFRTHGTGHRKWAAFPCRAHHGFPVIWWHRNRCHRLMIR